MASAKTVSAIDVRIDDVGSILKFRIGFPFGKNSAGFCKSVWLPDSILNFRIGSVSSIGGLIATTLFADTVSDSQNFGLLERVFNREVGVSVTQEVIPNNLKSVTGNRQRNFEIICVSW